MAQKLRNHFFYFYIVSCCFFISRASTAFLHWMQHGKLEKPSATIFCILDAPHRTLILLSFFIIWDLEYAEPLFCYFKIVICWHLVEIPHHCFFILLVLHLILLPHHKILHSMFWHSILLITWTIVHFVLVC